MRWQWSPGQASTPPGDGFVWLGGFRLGIDEEVDGKQQPVLIGGSPSQPMALLARVGPGGDGIFDRGFDPVTDPALPCLAPRTWSVALADRTPATVTVQCRSGQSTAVRFSTP
jgi:hypothetical protein